MPIKNLKLVILVLGVLTFLACTITPPAPQLPPQSQVIVVNPGSSGSSGSSSGGWQSY